MVKIGLNTRRVDQYLGKICEDIPEDDVTLDNVLEWLEDRDCFMFCEDVFDILYYDDANYIPPWHLAVHVTPEEAYLALVQEEGLIFCPSFIKIKGCGLCP